jgi:hypothetical protein
VGVCTQRGVAYVVALWLSLLMCGEELSIDQVLLYRV